MQFRVDIDGMTFIVGGIRGVTEYETKAQVLDKTSGVPLFDVDVMAVVTNERAGAVGGAGGRAAVGR